MAKQLIQSAEKANAVSQFNLGVTYANGLDELTLEDGATGYVWPTTAGSI